MTLVKKIPEGFHTIIPTLVLPEAARAIEMYTKAFDAREEYRMACADSPRIMHACLMVGNSKLFICDADPSCRMATTSNFYLYFDDVDAMMEKAKQAGLLETMPATDMFWGDRMGCVKDRYGNNWSVATHVRDVSPAELEAGRKQMMSKSAA